MPTTELTAEQEKEFFKELERCQNAYYFYTKYCNLPHLTEQQFTDMVNREQVRILDEKIYSIKLKT